MQKMSNLDYHWLEPELRELQGTHLQKFFEISEGHYRLDFGKKMLTVILGTAVFLGKTPEPSPDSPTQTAMAVRKRLQGAKLEKISQINFDRIIELCFEFFGKPVSLVFEMHNKPNLIICEGSEKRISFRLKREERLERDEIYSPPKTTKLPPNKLNEAIGELGAGGKLSDLQSKIALPRDSILQFLGRAELEQDRHIRSLSQKELEGLENTFRNLLSYSGSAFASEKGFSRLPQEGMKECDSFSQALENYYSNPENRVEGKKPVENSVVSKLRKDLGKKERVLEALEKEENASKEKAEFIYSNFPEIEKLLESRQLPAVVSISGIKFSTKKSGNKIELSDEKAQ